MRRRLLSFPSLLVAIGLAACGPAGSGNLVTEERPAGEFDRIELSGALHLDLTVDAGAEPSISVTFDDNLIDRIGTRIAGGTLTVDADGSYRTTGGGRFIEVVTPTLVDLEVSGASDVDGVGNAPSIRLDVSGASDVDLSGLAVKTMVLEASGASDVTIFVVDAVTGDASGASDVTVLGDPSRLDIETSGASDIDTG